MQHHITMRRTAMFATAVVLSCGLGVFGTSAAFADVAPTDTTSAAPTDGTTAAPTDASATTTAEPTDSSDAAQPEQPDSAAPAATTPAATTPSTTDSSTSTTDAGTSSSGTTSSTSTTTPNTSATATPAAAPTAPVTLQSADATAVAPAAHLVGDGFDPQAGTVVTGSTLTATPEGFDAGSDYTYVWWVYDHGWSTPSTSATFTAGNVGSFIYAEVTGTVDGTEGTVATEEPRVIAAQPAAPGDTNDNSAATVFITGAGVDEAAGNGGPRQEMGPGVTFSADLQGWNRKTEFSYEWRGINVAAAQANAGDGGDDPDGSWHPVSTDPTFTPTEAGWDYQLVVDGTVPGVDGAYDKTAYSQVIDIVGPNDKATASISGPGLDADSGTIAPGTTITAEAEGWADGTTFTYEWYQFDPEVDTQDDGYQVVSTAKTFTVKDGTSVYLALTGTYKGQATTKYSSQAYNVMAADVEAPSFPVDSVSLSVDAGQEFAQSFDAKGDDVEYSVVDGSIPDGITRKGASFSGSTEFAGTYSIVLQAENSAGNDRLTITLTVKPGKAIGSGFVLVPVGAQQGGDIYYLSNGEHGEDFTPKQGSSVYLTPVVFDKYGNWTPAADLDLAAPVITSSFPTDQIVWDAATGHATITFPHASPHTITMAYAGFTTSAALQVTPSAVAPVITGGDAGVTVTNTAANVGASTGATVNAGTRDGSLAYTGSDDAGLGGLALGLLGLGGLMTALRFRRRRTQR